MIASVWSKTDIDGATLRGLAKLILLLDFWLCRLQNVFEYSRSRECIFRAQLNRIRKSRVFRSGEKLGSGERIVTLHFWNEQVPPFPKHGPTIGWALRMNRGISGSLCELACYFRTHPELMDVSAVRIVAPIGARERTEQIVRLLGRHGFEPPVSAPLGVVTRIGWFFDNLYISLLVLAQNRRALRCDTIRRWRVEVFLQRATLDRRYSTASLQAHSSKQLI
jgi:hypothetical protein